MWRRTAAGGAAAWRACGECVRSVNSPVKAEEAIETEKADSHKIVIGG